MAASRARSSASPPTVTRVRRASAVSHGPQRAVSTGITAHCRMQTLSALPMSIDPANPSGSVYGPTSRVSSITVG
jgi:hypothetical protein